MKQIKTVIEPLNRSETYDYRVNNLLSSGWRITRRGITHAYGEPSESFNTAIEKVLYAELERDIEYPEEVTL